MEEIATIKISLTADGSVGFEVQGMDLLRATGLLENVKFALQNKIINEKNQECKSGGNIENWEGMDWVKDSFTSN